MANSKISKTTCKPSELRHTNLVFGLRSRVHQYVCAWQISSLYKQQLRLVPHCRAVASHLLVGVLTTLLGVLKIKHIKCLGLPTRHPRTPITGAFNGQVENLTARGLRKMRALSLVGDAIALDIWIFICFFKSWPWPSECEWGQNRGVHPMGEWRMLLHWNLKGEEKMLEILYNVKQRPVCHDQRAYSSSMLR